MFAVSDGPLYARRLWTVKLQATNARFRSDGESSLTLTGRSVLRIRGVKHRPAAFEHDRADKSPSNNRRPLVVRADPR